MRGLSIAPFEGNHPCPSVVLSHPSESPEPSQLRLDASTPDRYTLRVATILDLPEVLPRLVRWTVDEYEHLAEQGLIPKQAELLRGLVIEKMPKSPLHRALAKRLYDLIDTMRASRTRWHFSAFLD